MDCSIPGFPVYHQLPELTQTHVHWVGDAIQPSHPLSFPSPPAFNLSQLQGLFQGASSSHQVAKVLEVLVSASASVLPKNIQDWFPLGWTGWISLQSRDPQESSPAPNFLSQLSARMLLLPAPFLLILSEGDGPLPQGPSQPLTRHPLLWSLYDQLLILSCFTIHFPFTPPN